MTIHSPVKLWQRNTRTNASRHGGHPHFVQQLGAFLGDSSKILGSFPVPVPSPWIYSPKLGRGVASTGTGGTFGKKLHKTKVSFYLRNTLLQSGRFNGSPCIYVYDFIGARKGETKAQKSSINIIMKITLGSALSFLEYRLRQVRLIFLSFFSPSR